MNASSWAPAASRSTLQQRARIISDIRQFFAERDVMEVETPLLTQFSVTDPHMFAFAVGTRFLQTSPEYAMKRMLAAGYGPIFQLCKAFREGEQGRRHNPEFTMLEWYRPGFDHFDLMAEIDVLMQSVLRCQPCDKVSYRELFLNRLHIDPHQADAHALAVIARQHIDVQMNSDYRDDWLNLLMAQVIEPALGLEAPVFVYDYPASQAALAQLASDQQNNCVAQRFELYFKGVELANGYCELTDAKEQARRFDSERALRRQLQRPDRSVDRFLHEAMQSGLPECSGVALGIDRLVMLALGLDSVEQVLSFSFGNS